MRDGGDVEDGIRLGQGVIAGVVAERVFVAERLDFDDEHTRPVKFCPVMRKARRSSRATSNQTPSAGSRSLHASGRAPKLFKPCGRLGIAGHRALL